MIPVIDVPDTYRIDMGIDRHDLLSVTHPADNVSEAVNLHFVKLQFFHLSFDACYYFLFLTALTRVRYHFTEEPDHIRTVFFCCFLNFFVIQCHLFCLLCP